jgi:hypothetical protein
MVIESAEEHNVDVRLLMAIMQQDSQFGTAGVGVKTKNPGNVGNTGKKLKFFASWESGIDAAAAWLKKHRIES